MSDAKPYPGLADWEHAVEGERGATDQGGGQEHWR